MTPTHHPSDAVLCDYASGAMRSHFASVVAAHVERCRHCREAVERLEAVGFAMIEALPPAPMGEDRLARAMAGLDCEMVAAPPAEPIAFEAERADPAGGSVRFAPDEAGGRSLYLLRLPAGHKVPRHRHTNHRTQFTTVLSGAYEDQGQVHRVGDFCELSGAFEHGLRVPPGEDCVCMVANDETRDAMLANPEHGALRG